MSNRIFHCQECKQQTTHERAILHRKHTHYGQPIEFDRDCYVCDECGCDQVMDIRQQIWTKLEIDGAIQLMQAARELNAELLGGEFK